MLKKVFVQCLFGQPFPWTGAYLENFARLESTGWHMKIFTPNEFPVPPNVELVPMTLVDYDSLVSKYCGVHPKNYLSSRGVPNKLTSDHYPAQGLIFQDYLKDADYWVITNWDVAYGRLSKSLPDEELQKWDVWSDDPCGFNGIFTVMRNTEKVNNLFREVPHWEHYFTIHAAFGFDEIRFSEALRRLAAEGRVAWGHPEHFPLHSYDRLVMHKPDPHLYFEDDGALIEWYEDRTHPPSIKRHYGRELFLFHFSATKRWPIGPMPA